ncbi:MAG TPA: hypothetical protein VD902_21735, partial [Symbiobacteriaceae bacterium]|nr:hypothetical protein [Symbiobacteriaceae bacterium]
LTTMMRGESSARSHSRWRAACPTARRLLLTLPEIRALDTKNPAELFDYLFTEPLRHVIDGGRERYLIVIDALDEASKAGRNTLAATLAAHAPRLPGWIGFVVTGRPENEVLNPLQGLRPVILDTATESNRSDIREYLRNELAERLAGQAESDRKVEAIIEKSEGVFLYAERFCDDVRCGHLLLERPDDFPQGLGGIFYRYLQREFPDIAEFRRDGRPALRAILAAREPLPLELLQALFGWQDEERLDFVRRVGSLFSIAPRHYGTFVDYGLCIRPFHKSLADFLSNETKAGAYFVSRLEGHRALSHHGATEFHSHRRLSPYLADNLLYHMAAAGDWTLITELVREEDFLKASSFYIRQSIPVLAKLASTASAAGCLAQVPERYLRMAKQLEASARIVNGLLMPPECLSSCHPPLEVESYIAMAVEILVYYLRALDIGLELALAGQYDAARLKSLLDASVHFHVLSEDVWRRDYHVESADLANLSNMSQRLRAKVIEYLGSDSLSSANEDGKV